MKNTLKQLIVLPALLLLALTQTVSAQVPPGMPTPPADLPIPPPGVSAPPAGLPVPPPGAVTPPTDAGMPPNEATEAPEPPKTIMDIELQDGLLSVELLDADFRTVLTTIGQKAGFSVEGSSAAFSKKVTTKFQNIELERGVSRLLTIVNEKNFMMNYDAKGDINSIELYGGAAPAASQSTTPTRTTRGRTTTPRMYQQPAIQQPPAAEQPVLTTPPVSNMPVSRRMRFIRRQRQLMQTAPVSPEAVPPDTAPQPSPDDQPPADQEAPEQATPPQEEPAQEIPYIPQKKPVFIPSRQ